MRIRMMMMSDTSRVRTGLRVRVTVGVRIRTNYLEWSLRMVAAHS